MAYIVNSAACLQFYYTRDNRCNPLLYSILFWTERCWNYNTSKQQGFAADSILREFFIINSGITSLSYNCSNWRYKQSCGWLLIYYLYECSARQSIPWVCIYHLCKDIL